jgi:hypothetical protein
LISREGTQPSSSSPSTTSGHSSGDIDDGRWEIDEALSAQVQDGIARRTGPVHSYTLLTGFFERRIRGVMESFQVLGNR